MDPIKIETEIRIDELTSAGIRTGILKPHLVSEMMARIAHCSSIPPWLIATCPPEDLAKMPEMQGEQHIRVSVEFWTRERWQEEDNFFPNSMYVPVKDTGQLNQMWGFVVWCSWDEDMSGMQPIYRDEMGNIGTWI